MRLLGAGGQRVGRWLRRSGKRLLGWIGLPLLLVAGGLLYGLRYGFRPLPQAPPGFQLPYPPPNAVPWDQASGGWAAVRDLDWVAPALHSFDAFPGRFRFAGFVAAAPGRRGPFAAGFRPVAAGVPGEPAGATASPRGRRGKQTNRRAVIFARSPVLPP